MRNWLNADDKRERGRKGRLKRRPDEPRKRGKELFAMWRLWRGIWRLSEVVCCRLAEEERLRREAEEEARQEQEMLRLAEEARQQV